MKLLIVLALGLACCGQEPTKDSFKVVDHVGYDVHIAHAIVEETLEVLDADESIMEGWTIDLGPQGNGCGGSGCVKFPVKTIFVEAYIGHDGATAEVICHEMVHVYLMATTGDSDSTHYRQDLFNGQTGACSRVVAAFISE